MIECLKIGFIHSHVACSVGTASFKKQNDAMNLKVDIRCQKCILLIVALG
jgi:hypothetical protein